MNQRYSKAANIAITAVCVIMALMCILPLILVISISLTSEAGIVNHGYTFFPSEFSLDAYKYIWNVKDSIISAYKITILTTVMGTLISVLVISLYAVSYTHSEPTRLRRISYAVFCLKKKKKKTKKYV